MRLARNSIQIASQWLSNPALKLTQERKQCAALTCATCLNHRTPLLIQLRIVVDNRWTKGS
jgi:hypothetical protein